MRTMCRSGSNVVPTNQSQPRPINMTCRRRRSQHRRPRPSPDVSMKRRVVALLTMAAASSYHHGCNAFSAQTMSTPYSSSRIHFRRVQDIKSEDVDTSSIMDLPFTLKPANLMPTWLRQPRAHLAQDNLQLLRKAMMNSFFTQEEAVNIISAIEQAAQGDDGKVAGAAEFCLILVETMEMGANALVAAAFHYCSCITARERSVVLPQGSFSFSDFFDSLEDDNVKEFGMHVSEIAQDAARLKKIEMVATEVMQNSKSVTPDSFHDSENLRKLLLTETKDWRALAIRSAASLYRLRGILKSSSDGDRVELTPEIVRASREALHIYAPLASRLGMHRLKNELESAAFSMLYPRQYETVTSLTKQSRSLQKRRNAASDSYVSRLELMSSASIGQSMKEVLQGVQQEVKDLLAKDEDFSSNAENVSVTARVKEPYSMWRKMLKNRNDHILQVPDALALRIVLDAKKLTADEDDEVTSARERALCYYAQKLCTEKWRPADNPRFKDYIEQPKPNGYQSLHYTASTNWGGQDWSLEIQIRSWEMHSVAEYGLASHWDYKANKLGSSKYEENDATTKDAYLKSVQEWHWQQRQPLSIRRSDAAPATSKELFHKPNSVQQSKQRADRIRARTAKLAPYIEAFAEAKLDLERENVFVFLSGASVHADGKVLALPAGACVLDALREGERRFGIQVNWRQFETEVEHNGALACVTSKLQNGDVLTVPIREEQKVQEAAAMM